MNFQDFQNQQKQNNQLNPAALQAAGANQLFGNNNSTLLFGNLSNVGNAAFSNYQSGITNNQPETVTQPQNLIAPSTITSKTASTKAATIKKGIDTMQNLIGPQNNSAAPMQNDATAGGNKNAQGLTAQQMVDYSNGKIDAKGNPITTAAATTAPAANNNPDGTPKYSANDNDNYLYNTADANTKSAIDAYAAKYGKLTGSSLSDFITNTQAQSNLADAKNVAAQNESAQELNINNTYDKLKTQEQERQKESQAMEQTGLAQAGVYAPVLQGVKSERVKAGEATLSSIEEERSTLIQQAKAALATNNIDLADKYFNQAQQKQQQAYTTRLQNEQLKQSEIQTAAAKLTQERNQRYVTVGSSLLDTQTNKFITDPTKDLTTDQKNYNVYSQQTSASGDAPMAFNDWLKQKSSKPQFFTDSSGTVTKYDPITGLQTSLGDIGKAGTSAVMADSDIQALADGVVAGTIPPDLKGLYKYGGPVRAKLAEQGFDLTTASNQYLATQKFITASNSTAQVRMKQAEASVENSLGNLQSINQDFERTGFKFANKAELVAASNGLLEGQYPGSTQKAQNLLGQIALITDELGQTFMGGNSPTDAAFGLAKQVLSSDFSQDTLKSQIDLISKNLQYRKNSWSQITPTTLGNQPNPYVPTSSDTSSQGGGYSASGSGSGSWQDLNWGLN